MPVLATRLSPVAHEAFLAQCERKGLKAADVIRKFIDAFNDRAEFPDEGLGHHGPRARDQDRLIDLPRASDKDCKRIVAAFKRAHNPAPHVRGFSMDGEPIVKVADRGKK